jgi:hypothetical protein
MATLDHDGWELVNVEERHAERPDRFHIPSHQERESLAVGARVQLHFAFRTVYQGRREEYRGRQVIQVERMWVTIREATGSHYAGTLDSDPVTSRVLRPGDRIEFGPEHVATVLIPRSDPRHPDFGREQQGTP